MEQGTTLAPRVTAALLATARPPGATLAQQEALAAALEEFDPGDWIGLIEGALNQGTASLLSRHLLEAAPGRFPPEMVAACDTYLAARRQAAAEAIAQLAAVMEALAVRGVSALPFKGPVLGLQAYGDAGLREYHDLDILIRREQLIETLAVLDALGYRSEAVAGLRPRRVEDYYRYNGQDILFAPGRLPIEPHWAFAPRTFCAELDTGPIFARAVRVEAPHGQRFRCFAPEDTLLAASLHGGKEQWARLIWIADIAALLHAHPALDWTAVLARAAEAGCLRMTLLAAELARGLLEADLPDRVRAEIARDRAVAPLVARVRAALFARVEAPSIYTVTSFRWNVRERLSDRLRYATRTLFRARVTHFRNVDLPDPLSFLYPAVRLGHDFLVLPVWRALHRTRD
ncbi:MAG TPA: nucleotidyltransferase family protein [Acetobacteraceae bacterium]|nr:nucleotidyltransferase family protein [Acetobacteraceae bacterium]